MRCMESPVSSNAPFGQRDPNQQNAAATIALDRANTNQQARKHSDVAAKGRAP